MEGRKKSENVNVVLDRSEEQYVEKQFIFEDPFSLVSDQNKVDLPQLEQAASESVTGSAEGVSGKSRDPEFIKYRSLWSNPQANRRPEQQVDDVRCMFNMVHSIARPVLQQDASLQEATVAPRTADQLLLDLQQLGLVRDKGGPGGETGLDGRTDQEPILKDLKLVQEIPMERPVFHCFFKELIMDKKMGLYIITIEQSEDAFVMMAYNEPSDGQTTLIGIELARFPKFPQITDGFCLSDNGDFVVFTCTLLGCVVCVSLSSCIVETDPSATAAAPDAVDVGNSGPESGNRRSSLLVLGRRDHRDNQSRNSSQSSIEATGADQMFHFLPNRVVTVAEANYKLSEPISEHVYDVCLREMSNTSSGTNKSALYVTNKSNIAVVNMTGLKLDNFLFEGLRLPWRLKLHKHLLIIAEKWGSVQIADLDKEHRSLCVTDMQGLSCENGLKSIEVVPEHNLLLLTVYPEGNQAAGHYPEDVTSTSGGASRSPTVIAAPADARIGGGGGGQGPCDGTDDGSWSCHCFHFNPESTHGNPVLRYAQTMRLSRSPLSTIYSEVTKRLYILSFHPARNNSALLLKKLEVFHEERGRTAKFTAKLLLPQRDEDEYKAAVDGLAGRRLSSNEAGKLVEMLDLTGSPVVALMKAPMNLGFK